MESTFSVLKTKGVVDDITGAISNTNDDPEMPGRTLGVGRPWVDPSVTVNIHSREVKFLCPYFVHSVSFHDLM